MSSPLQQHEPDLAGRPTYRTIANLIESAAASFEADPGCSRDCLYRAAALLRRDCAASRHQELPRGGLAAWQVGRVMSYIQDNLGVSMKVEDLASLVNLSAGQFFRAFKVSVGVPPFHYILRKRLDLACKMMATTDESLSQIAIACGLYDQSHLCRMFRRMVGESPNAWRRKNASGPTMKHLV